MLLVFVFVFLPLAVFPAGCGGSGTHADGDSAVDGDGDGAEWQPPDIQATMPAGCEWLLRWDEDMASKCQEEGRCAIAASDPGIPFSWNLGLDSDGWDGRRLSEEEVSERLDCLDGMLRSLGLDSSRYRLDHSTISGLDIDEYSWRFIEPIAKLSMFARVEVYCGSEKLLCDCASYSWDQCLLNPFCEAIRGRYYETESQCTRSSPAGCSPRRWAYAETSNGFGPDGVCWTFPDSTQPANPGWRRATEEDDCPPAGSSSWPKCDGE